MGNVQTTKPPAREPAAGEMEIVPTDPDVIRANFEADDGWRYVCRVCGKTPQDIGWCDQCGYNRPYEKVRPAKLQ